VEIKIFYHTKLNYTPVEKNSNFSESPEKPAKFIEYLKKKDLLKHFAIEESFPPFEKQDFYIAHQKKWVDDFFSGSGKLQRKNILGIPWSAEYANSVKYTNSCLYHAIRQSIVNPDEICLAPVSGFHHANPRTGALFCAFSGQVIASYKIYKEFGLSGCYIDLDGHYGNSIDNSYGFVPELEKAIPKDIGNINIGSRHGEYIKELKEKLTLLRANILQKKIHYVVFCHGADSHEDDDLGTQLTTEEWFHCSELVYGMVKELQTGHGIRLPLSLCLFGGYRKDDFDSVLALHAGDLVICLREFGGQYRL
jgi:acetoin utilization deacetylase AcuC-like enzyme